MRIIDVHTHFFPDSIAKETIRTLEAEGRGKSASDGTSKSLKEFMATDNVSVSVNAPVATKKEQVKGINRKMIEFNGNSRDIICFGAMHPDFSSIGNVKEEVEFMAKNGIKGIKLHADYQDFYPDDMKLYGIYDSCRKNNIAILFHAGKDPAFKEARATPERLAQVAKIDGLKVIFAHMGSLGMWEDVVKHLVGKKVYFDTSDTVKTGNNLFKEIVIKHGTDKILFGSDFPWARASDIIKKVEETVNYAVAREMIFHKNAEELLNLS